FARVSAGLSVLIATLVLIGWSADIEPLKRILPGLVAMNPMTAVAFLLAGLSLWLQPADAPASAAPPSRRQLAMVAAAVVLGIGALKLAAAGLGWDAGVDQWLFADKLAGAEGGLPNRMAPNTALNFLLLGFALFLLDVTTVRGRRPSEYLAALVGFGGFFGLVGYVFQLSFVEVMHERTPMALHTAIAFLLLTFAVLGARPQIGFMAVVTGPGLGGSLVRRLYPALVLAVMVTGWLRLEGERRGLYGLEVGLALYASAFIALSTILVARSAAWLHRAETERERVATARDEAQALNTLILDNSLDVICVVDGEGRFVEVSAASLQLWGYAPSELVGRAYADLVHPDDAEKTGKVAAEIMAGQPTGDFSNRYLRKDGSHIDIDWSAIWSEADGLMFAVARDATQRKQAELAVSTLNAELSAQAVELQQTNSELESFSYSVSHDLRAPLRHIDGYAKMLQEDAGDQLDEEMRRYLDSIGESARRMGVLIDDLLAFSKLGRKPVQRVDMDMRALVQRVAEELQLADDPRVAIGPLPEAQADPVLFKQVWLNLLSNAIKYSTPRGGDARVDVSGERDGERVRYRIRDNGVGFDMRYAENLFGVFQRLHSQDEFEGTGVGLAIVQRIVARHGGSITADSQLGLGATFTLELPLGVHRDMDQAVLETST
ncbi:MAG: ATP-binding protein, partial [Pseudomonadota bacterium]|nr:ATP-binding protein [Pseudomonadota bacterium]